MDEEKAGEAIYETFAGPTRGREIDVRPDPGGARAGQETTVIRRPAPKLVLNEEVAARSRDWPEGHTTGAFVSAAASLRHEVEPYRWWQVSGWMLLLWVLFVGVPAGGAIWAVCKIYGRVHH